MSFLYARSLSTSAIIVRFTLRHLQAQAQAQAHGHSPAHKEHFLPTLTLSVACSIIDLLESLLTLPKQIIRHSAISPNSRSFYPPQTRLIATFSSLSSPPDLPKPTDPGQLTFFCHHRSLSISHRERSRCSFSGAGCLHWWHCQPRLVS